MAIPTRSARPGTYFITTTTHNRRRLFQVERNTELLLETIDYYRDNYFLHAYVVMPDRVHLLVTPASPTESHRSFRSGREASPTTASRDAADYTLRRLPPSKSRRGPPLRPS